MINNVRILTLNPRGRVPTDKSETSMLAEAMKRHQINMVLLNETNAKWNAMSKGRVEIMFKKIDREEKMTTVDSKEWNVTLNDYLPGRLRSEFCGKYRLLMQEEKMKIGKLGN